MSNTRTRDKKAPAGPVPPPRAAGVGNKMVPVLRAKHRVFGLARAWRRQTPASGTRPRRTGREIWPFLHAIVAAGDTFCYDPAMDEATARAMWMVGPPGRATVAVAPDGPVLGTANMYANRPGPGAHVASGNVMVAAEHQGRGVGRVLLADLLEWAREEGLPRRAVQRRRRLERARRRPL